MTQDRDLVVQWIAPPSNSRLTYTVRYDTVPPSDNQSFMMMDIEALSIRIPEDKLLFDRSCSVGVRARDEVTMFSGSWSYAENCFVASVNRPETPKTSITFTHPLYELKWDPPTNTNGFISRYAVELKNETRKDLEEGQCVGWCEDQRSYENKITLKSDSTDYREVINVTDNTCFCAVVEAVNAAGSSSMMAVHFYKYQSRNIVVGPTGQNIGGGGGSDSDNDPPFVAIVLGAVLVIVAVIALVLAIVFLRLRMAHMKQGGPSESRKELNAYN